jgi:zinc metalloprotease ZmpB
MSWKDSASSLRLKNEHDQVRYLSHPDTPFVLTDSQNRPSPYEVASRYLQEISDLYGIDPSSLDGIGRRPMTMTDDTGIELRLELERSAMGTTVLVYRQTMFGLPIWKAGVAISVNDATLGVVSSRSSFHRSTDLDEKGAVIDNSVLTVDAGQLRSSLNFDSVLSSEGSEEPVIVSARPVVFRYEPGKRVRREALLGTDSSPVDLLPEVPAIITGGRHYVAQHVVSRLSWGEWGDLVWRVIIEPVTGTVLYLRLLTSGATGKIFPLDPHRQGAPYSGQNPLTPSSSDTELAPWTQTVNLLGLAPPDANIQHLDSADNEFVRIADLYGPPFQPPSKGVPYSFTDFPPKSANFAAVQVYY